jgi:choline dehydrogenase-like flavoprotein
VHGQSNPQGMIDDFNKFADENSVAADICVIGAGAAGITIAREFLGTQLKVVVLEGGGLDPEPDSQELFESEAIGLPHAGVHDGRARILGGTTSLWGGQALRFDPFDFEERSWVPYSGWPISREALDSYYERAERILHLGAQLPFERLCASFGIEPPISVPPNFAWNVLAEARNQISQPPTARNSGLPQTSRFFYMRTQQPSSRVRLPARSRGLSSRV